jgi:hypothetical protein
MLYEHHSEPLLPVHLWRWRILRSAGLAAIVACTALAMGVLGYHIIGGLSWVDALLEASMILGGMGPVATMANDAVKVFASLYALFSGLVLIGTMGILLGPWLHRMMHLFHSEEVKKRKQ